MITKEYVITMARYNLWQNTEIFRVAEEIGETERRRDRGSFFGSIHGTLSHLLWGDMIWTSRFAGMEAPPATTAAQSAMIFPDWNELKQERRRLDPAILRWANGLDAGLVAGALSWRSVVTGRDMERPFPEVLVHFFNHQTHHRGQVHAMVTACGGVTSDTDLVFLPMEGSIG